MVSNLMIVDSRIYYRMLSIALLNKPAYHLLLFQYLLLRRLLGGHLQTWWWQISLQIIAVF